MDIGSAVPVKAFYRFCYAPTNFPPPLGTETCCAPGPPARRRWEASKDWNDRELLSNSKMVQQKRLSALTILCHSNTVRGEGNPGVRASLYRKVRKANEAGGTGRIMSTSRLREILELEISRSYTIDELAIVEESGDYTHLPDTLQEWLTGQKPVLF